MVAKKTISREVPLSEITLRRYEKPSENLSGRELMRKVCLALGLLQPGDSRDVVVDVLHVIVDYSKRRKFVTMTELVEYVSVYRTNAKVGVLGSTLSNITRQVRRLKELGIVEKQLRGYRVREFSSLSDVFDEHVKDVYLTSITKRVEAYLKLV